MFNPSTKKKEIPSTQSNSYNSQHMYPNSFSFNNPLIYPNSYPSFYGENSYYFSQVPMQPQGFVNTNILHEGYTTDGYMNVITNSHTNMNTATTQDNISTSLQKLTIEQFLENLDKEYGIGMFTKYLNAFKEQEVDVLDIVNLKDDDWVKLGVDKIGSKSKIIK